MRAAERAQLLQFSFNPVSLLLLSCPTLGFRSVFLPLRPAQLDYSRFSNHFLAFTLAMLGRRVYVLSILGSLAVRFVFEKYGQVWERDDIEGVFALTTHHDLQIVRLRDLVYLSSYYKGRSSSPRQRIDSLILPLAPRF